MLPAPMLKATVTFGTARPSRLSTLADTASWSLKPELAVRTRLAGVAGRIGAVGGGGGSTPSQATTTSDATRIRPAGRHRRSLAPR
jgi:hypothetical protein